MKQGTSVFRLRPLPWRVEDPGDDAATVVDANDKYVVYQNSELTLAQWEEVIARLNYSTRAKAERIVAAIALAELLSQTVWQAYRDDRAELRQIRDSGRHIDDRYERMVQWVEAVISGAAAKREE